MKPRASSDHDTAVHTVWKRAVCTFALAMLIALPGGCASRTSSVDSDNPRDLAGYYEERYDGKLYILGSMDAVQKLHAGKAPKNFVPSFSRTGQPLVFEDDGPGMAQRLMAEYDRRWGMR